MDRDLDRKPGIEVRHPWMMLLVFGTMMVVWLVVVLTVLLIVD